MRHLRHHIANQFVRRCHRFPEEIDDDCVESLSQGGVSFKCLLFGLGSELSAKIRGIRTYNFYEELVEYSDKLIIDKLTAFETRLFQSFDLLFDNNLESSCTDEQRRRRTLQTEAELEAYSPTRQIRNADG
jgi:hypothetical protein